MADWSGLLPDLVSEIAKQIELIDDYMAFRAVCRSWRAAASKDKFVAKSWPRVPLLMLSEEEEEDDGDDSREFYSLDRGKVCMKLPVAGAKGKKCIEVRFGWLLTIGLSSSVDDNEVHLLNPLSGEQIALPNLSSFPGYAEYTSGCAIDQVFFLERAVLSANPSATSDFVLMVAARYLGIWRSGDESWTRVQGSNICAYSDVSYFDGMFYAINYPGQVWAMKVNIDPPLELPRPLLRLEHELTGIDSQLYLVGAGDDDDRLLVVVRNLCEGCNYGATRFVVIELDLKKQEWKQITSLGNNAIFLGHNAAFSVDVRAGGGGLIIPPNRIYFTDDCIFAYTDTELGGGKDMGVYNLEDGSIERFENVHSFSALNPPTWVALSF